MAFDKFFELLMMVYITVLHILQRVSITHSLLTRIIVEAKERGLAVGMESLKNIQEPSSTTKGSPGKKSPPGRMRY